MGTELRDAARQALMALDWYAECAMVSDKAADAASALRAALEQPERAQAMRDAGYTRRPTLREMAEPKQPEQEPVAIVSSVTEPGQYGVKVRWLGGFPQIAMKLYTHPPRREPEQEPVAWTLTETLDKRETTTTGYLWFSDPQNSAWTPLYPHPPRREWRGLTEGEISAVFPSHLRGDYKDLIPYSFARAIEAALKEKNT